MILVFSRYVASASAVARGSTAGLPIFRIVICRDSRTFVFFRSRQRHERQTADPAILISDHRPAAARHHLIGSASTNGPTARFLQLARPFTPACCKLSRCRILQINHMASALAAFDLCGANPETLGEYACRPLPRHTYVAPSPGLILRKLFEGRHPPRHSRSFPSYASNSTSNCLASGLTATTRSVTRLKPSFLGPALRSDLNQFTGASSAIVEFLYYDDVACFHPKLARHLDRFLHHRVFVFQSKQNGRTPAWPRVAPVIQRRSYAPAGSSSCSDWINASALRGSPIFPSASAA